MRQEILEELLKILDLFHEQAIRRFPVKIFGSPGNSRSLFPGVRHCTCMHQTWIIPTLMIGMRQLAQVTLDMRFFQKNQPLICLKK